MDLIQNTIVLNDFAHMKGLTTAIFLILLSGLASCNSNCHISGKIELSSMKMVPYAKVYNSDGNLETTAPVINGNFEFSVKKDRYECLRICFGSPRSDSYSEDFYAPYIIPDSDSIGLVIDKDNKIFGSRLSVDYNLMTREFENTPEDYDPFDEAATNRRDAWLRDFLSYLYLLHTNDRLGLDALNMLESSGLLGAKYYLAYYSIASKRMQRYLKKQLREEIAETMTSSRDDESQQYYLERGCYMASTIIAEHSLADSLKGKPFIAFLSKNSWLIASKVETRYHVYYKPVSVEVSYRFCIVEQGHRDFGGIESLFNAGDTDVEDNKAIAPGSLMDFYFLSVSEDHNEYCHLNSNMACGQHQDQVLPVEGIVSAYHFMNQYVSEP